MRRLQCVALPALLAVIAFAVVGCGSGAPAGSSSLVAVSSSPATIAPSPSPTLSEEKQATEYLGIVRRLAMDDYAAYHRELDVSWTWVDRSTWPAIIRGGRDYLRSLEDTLVKLEETTPPAVFAETHRKLQNAARACSRGYLALVNALESGDTSEATKRGLDRHWGSVSAANFEFRVAIRAATREAGVKLPSNILRDFPTD